VLHGEAVAIGMVCAARLSALMKRAPDSDGDRLVALLKRFGLPTEVPAQLDATRLLNAMRLDKKAVSGQLRLILWRRLGEADIVEGVSDALVLATLESCRAK
jgi:3-dehydroquinate synthase